VSNLTPFDKLILGCSGRFALSDDSHGPKLVGLNYARLHAYIQATGVKEIWYLERYEERNAGGRRVRPVKAGDEWHMRLQRTLELQKEDGKGS
jgi:histidinol-phosphatase (PHP family)